MPATSIAIRRESSSSTQKDLHILPCHINYDGPAEVSFDRQLSLYAFSYPLWQCM